MTASFQGFSPAPLDKRITDGGGQVFNVMSSLFGAYGDGGQNDDESAIQAAINMASLSGNGGTVYLPYRPAGYAASALILKSGVTLKGESRVALKRIGSPGPVFINATNITRSRVTGLSIDSAGLSTAATFRASGSSKYLAIDDCDITDSAQPTGVFAIDTQGASYLIIQDNLFHDMANSIRLNLGMTHVTVFRNLFSNWSSRCLYILGSSSASCTDIDVSWNEFVNMVPGGSVRQPFTVEGSDTLPHQRIRLVFNKAFGYIPDPINAPNVYATYAQGGTADLFSFHRTQDFLVIGNQSIGSGDVGLTVAEQCSHGSILGNTIKQANSCGMAIGAGTTTYVGRLAIVGNHCVNNGQNLDGQRSTTRSGIWMQHAQYVYSGSNELGDDQTTKTQQYGYILLNSDNIHLGQDEASSVGTGLISNGGGVTNSTQPAIAQAI